MREYRRRERTQLGTINNGMNKPLTKKRASNDKDSSLVTEIDPDSALSTRKTRSGHNRRNGPRQGSSPQARSPLQFIPTETLAEVESDSVFGPASGIYQGSNRAFTAESMLQYAHVYQEPENVFHWFLQKYGSELIPSTSNSISRTAALRSRFYSSNRPLFEPALFEALANSAEKCLLPPS